MTLDRRQTLFLYLVGIFITCLLVGDIIGGKLSEVTVFGVTLPISVGMIPFPLTFVLTDIVNEFYGKQVARKLTVLGFWMVAMALAFIYIADAVPWSSRTFDAGWKGMTAGSFDNVFVSATRIQIASMVAYLVAQFIDIGVFFAIKKVTGDRFLWLRATGSTVVSQLIDTIIIQFLAWTGIMPPLEIVKIIIASYAVKLFAAVVMTPVIYGVHAFLERMGILPVRVDRQGEHP